MDILYFNSAGFKNKLLLFPVPIIYNGICYGKQQKIIASPP